MLVPGLAAPLPGIADDALAPAPALSKCLARARPAPFGSRAPEQALLNLFDVDCEEAGAPFAPFCYLCDAGRAPARFCWQLDPVHLRADPQGLVLFDAPSCRLTSAERHSLLVMLRTFFSQQGWTLEAPAESRWYLFGPLQEVTTEPLSVVRGRWVAGHLPSGADAAAWLKLCNEIEMLLHTHPVNMERSARGLPMMNSVWISGGGVLPAATPGTPFDAVYADNALACGLGVHVGTDAATLPLSAGALLEQRGASQHILVLLDGCLQAADYGDIQSWNDCIVTYERDWFAPLLLAVSSRRVRSLDLLPLNGSRYRLCRTDLWRFWRTSPPYRATLSA